MCIYNLIAKHYEKKTEKTKQEVIKLRWQVVQMQKDLEKLKEKQEENKHGE